MSIGERYQHNETKNQSFLYTALYLLEHHSSKEIGKCYLDFVLHYLNEYPLDEQIFLPRSLNLLNDVSFVCSKKCWSRNKYFLYLNRIIVFLILHYRLTIACVLNDWFSEKLCDHSLFKKNNFAKIILTKCLNN
jgi:hypothetical protein